MSERYRGTRIVEPPTLEGAGGKAWRVTLPPPGQRARPDYDATVGAFIVQVPGAHIAWDHWAVSLIHLRPIAGVKPAHIRVEGNTHEFMILALDPTEPLPGLYVGPDWRLRFLTPIDVVVQFAAASDVVADQILELAARSIVEGHASPDQDWRPWWARVIATTAQHYRDGTHAMGRPS